MWSWYMLASIPFSDESATTCVLRSLWNGCRVDGLLIAIMSCWYAFSSVGPHVNLTFLFSRRRRGAVVSSYDSSISGLSKLNFALNWHAISSERTSSMVSGFPAVSMWLSFPVSAVTPFPVNILPNHFTLVRQNVDFSLFSVMPFC